MKILIAILLLLNVVRFFLTPLFNAKTNALMWLIMLFVNSFAIVLSFKLGLPTQLLVAEIIGAVLVAFGNCLFNESGEKGILILISMATYIPSTVVLAVCAFTILF